MNTFSSRINKLFEGGNAIAIDRETGDEKIGGVANKINLKDVNRAKLTSDFIFLFDTLNELMRKEKGKPLWKDFNIISSGLAFNGSSESLFNKKISDEEFLENVNEVGDIDLTIPENLVQEFFELLSTLENKTIFKNNDTKIDYIGNTKQKPVGKQLHTVFNYKYDPQNSVNVQVDFEGSKYDKEGNPTDFSKFGRTSDWDDIKKGFKGVHHKYLLMNLFRGSTHNPYMKVITKNGKLSTRDHGKSGMTAFSIDNGVREKFKNISDSPKLMDKFIEKVGLDPEENIEDFYVELETKDSSYTTNVEQIFKKLFNEQPSQQELDNFWSFTGLVDLMGKYLNEDQIKKAFYFLVFNNLWGEDVQRLYRNNPDKDRDYKERMENYLYDTFPYLKTMAIPVEIDNESNDIKMFDIINDLKKDYYSDYQKKKESL